MLSEIEFPSSKFSGNNRLMPFICNFIHVIPKDTFYTYKNEYNSNSVI